MHAPVPGPARIQILDQPLTLTATEFETIAAIFDRLYPADQSSPGARSIGAHIYLDRALVGWLRDCLPLYRRFLRALDRCLDQTSESHFRALTGSEQDAVLGKLERGELAALSGFDQPAIFAMMLAHCQEGLFADPLYGGNRDKAGWASLGHPGVWLSTTAEENLAATPVVRDGRILSLTDVRDDLAAQTMPEPRPINFDPARSIEPPSGPADIVLVGVGAVGGLIAPILARAGLRVVGLEAGPWRSPGEFVPDELGATYYCRQSWAQSSWPRNPLAPTSDEPTRDPTYSLGRMMNDVGGSVIHYGAWLRRSIPII